MCVPLCMGRASYFKKIFYDKWPLRQKNKKGKIKIHRTLSFLNMFSITLIRECQKVNFSHLEKQFPFPSVLFHYCPLLDGGNHWSGTIPIPRKGKIIV